MNAVAALLTDERTCDLAGVALPRAEVHIGVRFSPLVARGFDVSALGPRQSVHRKTIRSGQRTILARLRLGAHAAVLGVSATVIADRIVPIEELWDGASCRRLFDRLGAAKNTNDAAAILASAIEERVIGARRPSLALAAAARLPSASVSAVATDLGVSERHLRRIFRDTLGVSPKTFARLARFREAVRAARAGEQGGWACIAATAGYYDQAHLIAEFREIAGVTPQALLGELQLTPW